jgi:hypothetical protein
MKILSIFICSILFVFSFLPWPVYAIEKDIGEQVTLFLISDYRSVSNQGTLEYDSNNKLYLNSTVYLTGSAIRQDYNLQLSGIGLKYSPVSWLSANIIYEATLSDVNIGTIQPLFLAGNGGGIDFLIYNDKKDHYYSYITSFQELKFLINYIKSITDMINFNAGVGIAQHIVTTDPGGFGSTLKSNQTGTIFQAGAEYSITKKASLCINLNYESLSEINFPNFTQKLNPLSFETKITFAL